MKTMHYSVRRRLLLSLFFSMLVILGSVGLAANWVSQHEVDEIFSARLATSARVLEALLARQLEKATISQPLVITLPQALEHADSDEPTTLGHPYESKIAFQVWRSDGMLLAKSASAPVHPLGVERAGFQEQRLGDGTWNVFALKSKSVWIFTAEKNDVRNELSDEVSLSVLTPLVIGGIILLGATNWLVIRAIKPIEALAVVISSRDPSSLDPIELAQAPSELQPVIHELNELLNRVRAAFSREQRFIDSAAHELRTPIAALQLHVQNALAAPTDQERDDALKEALTASRRATKLAEQLLVYSRISASAGLENKQAVQLSKACESVINMMAPILRERQQHCTLQVQSDDSLLADRSKIERLVQNLIENASQYGSVPGEIFVRVQKEKNLLALIVENDGTPIPDNEKMRIFIPYYRALGTQAFGSGLGLAIVQEIVNQHDGRINVEDKSPGNGTRIIVRFALER